MKLAVILAEYREKITSYLLADAAKRDFQPIHMQEAALHYLRRGGKVLRSIVLLLICKAVGGDETKALPAAAAIEVYHTWTLIHDDIIDQDTKRRGHLTVQEEFYRRALTEMGYTDAGARQYGLALGVLSGDLLQGWAISLLCDLRNSRAVDTNLILFLVNDLIGSVNTELIAGQTIDIQSAKSLNNHHDIDSLVELAEKKTGALYRFAGRTGAMLGLNTIDPDRPIVKILTEFTAKCGIAFQLRDDILNIIGEEKRLGKSVGSDLREGKMTIILHHALINTNKEEQALLRNVIGNPNVTATELARVVAVIMKTGSIAYTQKMAETYIADACDSLDSLPALKYKELLVDWAHFCITRNS